MIRVLDLLIKSFQSQIQVAMISPFRNLNESRLMRLDKATENRRQIRLRIFAFDMHFPYISTLGAKRPHMVK